MINVEASELTRGGTSAVTPVPGALAAGKGTRPATWPAGVGALAVVDVLVLMAAVLLAGTGHVTPVVAAVLALPTLAGSGAYDLTLGRSALAAAGPLVVRSALVAAVVGSAATLLGEQDAAAAVLQWWLLTAVGVCLVRGGAGAALAARRRRGRGLRRAIVVGAGSVGRLAAERLTDHRALGLEVVGFVDDDPLPGHDKPLLGPLCDLERVIDVTAADTVIMAFSRATHAQQLDVVRRSWDLGLTVLAIPRLFEVEGARRRVGHSGALPFVALRRTRLEGVGLRAKQLVERLVAATMLVLLAPLLGAIALAVRIIDGGPVLHRAERVGRGGRPFEMLKFRTMTGDPALDGHAHAAWAEGVVYREVVALPARGSDRRTPLGRVLRRCGLDELPQLINVVRGEMAIIGPRPEIVPYVEMFSAAVPRYAERHRLLPGITGWAQVQGLRGRTSVSDRVEWDNFYIENWSPWLDLRILGLTVAAITRGELD